MTLYRIEHRGAAPDTKLALDITNSSNQISLVSPTGYPDGTIGLFVLVIDPDLANEEKILFVSRAGSSCTVSSSPTGRGFDSTTPSSHTAGAIVRHIASAVELDDFSDHVYTTTRDDHTQYLNTSRHDITARHTFGAALGTPASPSVSAPGASASAGTGATPARSDHVHGRESFGTGQSTTLAPNDSASDGASSNLARADHHHGMSNTVVASVFQANTMITSGGGIAASGDISSASLHTSSLTASAIDAATMALILPPGVLLDYCGSSPPAGFLLCDGSAVSRTTYSALFSAISTTYGIGDGSTTFNVPDFRGRVTMGVSGSHALGASGGEETHVLTTAELATHSHGVTDSGHTHTVNVDGSSGVSLGSNVGGGGNPADRGVANAATSSTSNISIQNNGSGTAHNNLQPYLTATRIIKF